MRAKLSSWLLIGLYLITRLLRLTGLPVFSDEAIYIRWAQLILNEPMRYLFFAMNDGKTPLFIWLMVPFQLLNMDQLWLGRIVSVMIGLAQVVATAWFAKVLGGRRPTQWLSALLVIILPFWYFHHRIALIDGLLGLTLTLAWVGVVHICRSSHFKMRWTIWTGFWFGMALWSKVPAVLAFPTLVTFPLLLKKNNWRNILTTGSYLGASVFISLLIFASLRISPSFGQLFSRGGDFLYPLSEIMSGGWKHTLPNIPTYISYFGQYFTYPLLLLVLTGLFMKHRQKEVHTLFWSALLFTLPIAVMGKVVYPRYLLPALVWLTPAAALSIQSWWATWFKPEQESARPNILKLALIGLVLLSLIGQTIASSSVFIATSLTNPSYQPLVAADQTQYLAEWSSGHGIAETREIIDQLRQSGSVAVLTEGSFGTLPDGLLLYYFRRPVENLYIEGIGQPIYEIPSKFIDRAKLFDHVLLVVNSHRMKLALPASSKLHEFCRPVGTVCLQIWDVTSLVKSLK